MKYGIFRSRAWRPRIWLTQPGQQKGAAVADDTPSPLNNVITIDDERIRRHRDRVVRGTVEETLNTLLDSEVPATTARPSDQDWRGMVEGTEAVPADVRDGYHRALSAVRELGEEA
jgi:hypothetical protein